MSSRVELAWRGKYDHTGKLQLSPQARLPLQCMETYKPGLSSAGGCSQMSLFPVEYNEWQNKIIHGDNLLALGSLVPEFAGKIDLIYIDPPFATGSTFPHRVTVNSSTGSMTYSETAYSDSWGQGMDDYLHMLYERLLIMSELLAPAGSLYLHVDPTVAHYAKVVMDEIFGCEAFQREIIWRIGWISGFKSAVNNWVRNHDTILFYARGDFTFNKPYLPYPADYQRRGGGRGRGYPVDDVWNANPVERELSGSDSLDSIQIKSFSREKTGFATQKPESLLRRIIAASSNEGDLVADFFSGSGTTLAAAESMNRRWLGCDQSPIAVHVARKRLLEIDRRRRFAIMSMAPHCQRWQLSHSRLEKQDYLLQTARNYGAELIADLLPVVGVREGAGVMITDIDRKVDQGSVVRAVDICRTRGWDELHVLSWQWDQDSLAVCADTDINIVPIHIHEAQGRDSFRRAAQLEAEIMRSGSQVTVLITKFTGPSCTDRSWQSFIDYWAVNWDCQGEFSADWAAWRTRNRPELPLCSPPHDYGTKAEAQLVVIAADVFGNQAQLAWQLRL